MTDVRPFRFGLLGAGVRTADDLVGTARAAEAAGYATFLLRDHFVEDPFGHQFAPLVALAAVAGATSTLRVGTLVLDNDYRHPVMLAKEAATLDRLSGGRLELGLGAGWLRAEYEAAGMPFDSAGVRIDRLAESVTVLKGLFAGAPCSVAGVHYTVTALAGLPTPSQQPHPPLLLAGGARRMLSLAAREADIVGVLNASVASGTVANDPTELFPETVDRKLGWVREAAGERFGRLELSTVVTVIVAADRPAAAARYAAEREWTGVPVERVLEMPSVFIGNVAEIADQMRARRDRFGFSYYVVGDADLAAFAPVVARLTGR